MTKTDCPMTPDELRGMADIIHSNELKELADWLEQQALPWNSVEEKPDQGVAVLANCRSGTYKGMYHVQGWKMSNGVEFIDWPYETPTCWTPIPPRPKTESEAE